MTQLYGLEIYGQEFCPQPKDFNHWQDKVII